MKKILSIVFIILFVSASIFAGGSKEESVENEWSWVIETDGFPQVNPLNVSGDIITAGSSTVFPVAEYLASQFQDEGYGDNITIDSIGSGGGFERFTVVGETDVANASRPIKQSEIEQALAIDRIPIEFKIGVDALAVVVNQENTWANDVTIEQLAEIMTADKWSDVNPEWPSENIIRFIPGTDSGTFDYFVEEIFDDDAELLLSAINVQLSEDDNILVQGVSNSLYAIAFFGYAYYVESSDVLKILDIEGVHAVTENVNNGTYPLARPLFVYSDRNIMREKPQVSAWLAYILNNANDAMLNVGYFLASDEDIELSKNRWIEATEGMF